MSLGSDVYVTTFCFPFLASFSFKDNNLLDNLSIRIIINSLYPSFSFHDTETDPFEGRLVACRHGTSNEKQGFPLASAFQIQPCFSFRPRGDGLFLWGKSDFFSFRKPKSHNISGHLVPDSFLFFSIVIEFFRFENEVSCCFKKTWQRMLMT